MLLIRQEDGSVEQCELHRENYFDGFSDAIDKVMEYTYSMSSDEKIELQQYLKQLKDMGNSVN